MLLIISTRKKKITAGGLYSLSPFLGSFSFPGNSRWRKFINEFIYRMSRMGSQTLSLGWAPSAFPFLLGGCFHKQVKRPPRGLQHKSQHFHKPCWIAMSQVWGGQDGPADEDENHSPIRERRELVFHLRATSPCDAFVCLQALPLRSRKDGVHLVQNLTTANTRKQPAPWEPKTAVNTASSAFLRLETTPGSRCAELLQQRERKSRNKGREGDEWVGKRKWNELRTNDVWAHLCFTCHAAYPSPQPPIMGHCPHLADQLTKAERSLAMRLLGLHLEKPFYKTVPRSIRS